MPTLEIEGHSVEVDPSFLQMTPEQQNAAVDEIGRSLPGLSASPRNGQAPGRRMDPGHANVPEFVPVGVEGYDPSTGWVHEKYRQRKGPELSRMGTAAVAGMEGVPIIGGYLRDAGKNVAAGIGSVVSGKPFADVKSEMGDMIERGNQQHPGARLAGNIAGGIVTLGPVASTSIGAQAFGLAGKNILTRSLASGATNAALVGADTLGRGGSIDDAIGNAAIAGPVGAVLPMAGRVISQMGSKAAVKAAPTIDALANRARPLIDAARQAGIAVKPAVYNKELFNLAAKLQDAGFNRTLHPRTMAVLDELSMRRGAPVDLGELETLRRIAGNAAMAEDGSERLMARKVIDTIDGIIDRPANFTVGKAGGPGTNALGMLTEFRATWHTMRKAETIEELFRRASIKGEGTTGTKYARALQAQFKTFALDPDNLRGFTAVERKAIMRVAQGGKMENSMETLGKFLRGVTSTTLGGIAGYGAAGPVGAAALVGGSQLAGMGLNRAAARIGINAAQRAGATVRSGSGYASNYAPAAVSKLEKGLRTVPLLTHERGR